MSFGRYGADSPGERKVSLEITVEVYYSCDSWKRDPGIPPKFV